MPKINPAIVDGITGLSKKDLEKLVIKAASKNKDFHDYLLVNYFDKTHGEEELFEQAKDDLELLFRKNYKGWSEELRLANMLAACLKRIIVFSKVCKHKNLEADLIIHTLQIPFSLPPEQFRTCFTAYNNKVTMLVKRLIKIVTQQLHEDYMIEYRGTINRYLNILHQYSSHLDYVYNLPKEI